MENLHAVEAINYLLQERTRQKILAMRAAMYDFLNPDSETRVKIAHQQISLAEKTLEILSPGLVSTLPPVGRCARKGGETISDPRNEEKYCVRCSVSVDSENLYKACIVINNPGDIYPISVQSAEFMDY